MTYLAPCFQYQDQKLHIENIAVENIAQHIPTPFYLYSATQIQTNVKSLQTALNKVIKTEDYTICYACKALNNIAVMQLIANEGLGADIVSSGELVRALTSDISADKIVFSGVGKTEKEVNHALSAGIRQINIESESELYLIEKIAKEKDLIAPVVFRLNPDVKAHNIDKISTGSKEDKFGLSADVILELFSYANKSSHINARGISVHIGSQLVDIRPYDKAYKIASDFISTLRAEGYAIDTIDLGGGIGIVYEQEDAPNLDEYADIVKRHIAPLGLHMIFEPGRMIVGNAGLLVSKVIHIKHADTKSFVIADAGMNDLMRPALYDGHHPVIELNKPDISDTKLYDVVGPVCESADVFGKNINLSHELNANDYIAFSGAGAYGATMSSYYNARDLPAEVLVKGSSYKLIREAITVEDFIKFENLADDLSG